MLFSRRCVRYSFLDCVFDGIQGGLLLVTGSVCLPQHLLPLIMIASWIGCLYYILNIIMNIGKVYNKVTCLFMVIIPLSQLMLMMTVPLLMSMKI